MKKVRRCRTSLSVMISRLVGMHPRILLPHRDRRAEHTDYSHGAGSGRHCRSRGQAACPNNRCRANPSAAALAALLALLIAHPSRLMLKTLRVPGRKDPP